MSGRVSTRTSQIWTPSARTDAANNNLRSQWGSDVPFTVMWVMFVPKIRRRVRTVKAIIPVQIIQSVNVLQPRLSRRRPNPAGISSTAKFRFSLSCQRSAMIVSPVPIPTRIVK